MRRIETNGYTVEVGSLLDSNFESLLADKYADSKKVILVDENTREYCLGFLVSNFEALNEAEVIMIPAGEESKTLQLTNNIWEALTEYGITRYDVIINLGGGVVTDMGGFIASCYKRGVDFINIPTTLLSMVDASIGGKTGINLGPFKNQIGVFSNPAGLFIDPIFLETLSEEELMSGYAEMLKHGLIADADLYSDVCDQMADIETIDELDEALLVRCIEVKNDVVSTDPFEGGLRKILNFGHTIGHAIEGHFLHSTPMSHGHSVAIGMVMEAYISTKIAGLDLAAYTAIETFMLENYPLPKFSDEDIQAMLELLQNDKKNKGGTIRCCLLPKIGECTYDHAVAPKVFLETFMHFKNKQVNLN